MANSMIRFSLFAGICVLTSSAKATEIIHLYPGEKQQAVFEENEEIHVSRKSIVELVKVEGELWEIYGLKPGSVVISQPRFDGQEKKTIVYVKKKPRGKEKREGRWQEFVCDEQGIQCSGHRIIGTSKDWQWFSKARHWCMKNQPCLWHVQLAKIAREEFSTYLLEHYAVESLPTKDGYFQFRSACAKDKIKWDLPDTLKELSIQNCVTKDHNFKVAARLYWLKHDDVIRFGLNLLGVSFQNLLSQDETLWLDFKQHSEQNMLAKPMLHTGLGRKSTARIGNDTVIVLDLDQKEVLRNGIMLEVKPLRQKSGELLTEVKLEMRHPQNSNNSVDTSEFSGELWIPLGQRFLVASISTSYDALQKSHSSLFENIPIVAPLFQKETSTNLTARVFLELTITADNQVSL